MLATLILSKEAFDKKELIDFLIRMAEELNLRVELKDLYNLDDIDLYENVAQSPRFIGFWIIKKEDLHEDRFEIGGEDFYISLYINHHSESLPELNIITRKLMTNYPNLLICEETMKEFYSYEDHQKGKVPEWLKV